MKVTMIPETAVTLKIELEKSLYDNRGYLPDSLYERMDEITTEWDADKNVFYFYNIEPEADAKTIEHIKALLQEYL